MGAQVISEIYRTNEHSGTYNIAVFIVYDKNTAKIYGLSETPKFSDIREIKEYLRSRGVTTVIHDRVHNGVLHEVQIKLRRLK